MRRMMKRTFLMIAGMLMRSSGRCFQSERDLAASMQSLKPFVHEFRYDAGLIVNDELRSGRQESPILSAATQCHSLKNLCLNRNFF